MLAGDRGTGMDGKGLLAACAAWYVDGVDPQRDMSAEERGARHGQAVILIHMWGVVYGVEEDRATEECGEYLQELIASRG